MNNKEIDMTLATDTLENTNEFDFDESKIVDIDESDDSEIDWIMDDVKFEDDIKYLFDSDFGYED
jgi:hypothetical protein